MNSDKKLILLAFCLLLLCIPKFLEERKLLRQTEASELSEDLALSFFYPLSNTERIEMIQEYLAQMEGIQEKISRSIVAKHFIDYRENISKREEDLRERQENLDDDSISFSTQQLHHIISDSSHTKEGLLALASLIDEVFPEEDLGAAIFALEKSPQHLINVYPYDDFKEAHFQSFVSRASEEVFNNEPIFLQVGSPESGDTDLYFHDQTPPITTRFLKETLSLPDPNLYEYSFDWGYKGQMPNGYQVIWCNVSTPTETYEEFHILKYDQDQWIVTNSISGCLGGEIKGNSLYFTQSVSEQVLLDQIVDLYPEFHYNHISQKNIGTGKAGYTGTIEFSAFITEEGKFLNREIVAFFPCEGWPPFSGQIYFKEDLLKLGQDFLTELDKR